MRRVPVLKDGINVGLSGLAAGDFIIIEMTHFLPLTQNLVETMLAYSFFRFEGFSQLLGQLFLSGDGYHLSEDEPEYKPIRVCMINCNCVRRISVFSPDDPSSNIAKIVFDLMERNEALFQENARLSNLNARLFTSHFNDSNLTQ